MTKQTKKNYPTAYEKYLDELEQEEKKENAKEVRFILSVVAVTLLAGFIVAALSYLTVGV